MVKVRLIAAAFGVQEVDVSVFTDVRLMNGQDDTAVYTELFPTPNGAAVQALAESDRNDLHLGNVSMAAAVVLAPGKRPFTVGKPAKILDINHFHSSSGHLNNVC